MSAQPAADALGPPDLLEAVALLEQASQIIRAEREQTDAGQTRVDLLIAIADIESALTRTRSAHKHERRSRP